MHYSQLSLLVLSATTTTTLALPQASQPNCPSWKLDLFDNTRCKVDRCNSEESPTYSGNRAVRECMKFSTDGNEPPQAFEWESGQAWGLTLFTSEDCQGRGNGDMRYVGPGEDGTCYSANGKRWMSFLVDVDGNPNHSKAC